MSRIARERQQWIYRVMNGIRAFEEKAYDLFCENKLRGPARGDVRADGEGNGILQGPRRVDAHIADLKKGNLGANAIVGGGIPIAVGGALARFLFFQGYLDNLFSVNRFWGLIIPFCLFDHIVDGIPIDEAFGAHLRKCPKKMQARSKISIGFSSENICLI